MRVRTLLGAGVGSVALAWVLACGPAWGMLLGGGVPVIEQGSAPSRVADRPFTLTASSLVLTGAAYHGVVEVPTRNGSRPALHFTATGLQITDLVQTAQISDGRTIRLAAEPGSTAVAEDGTIELYTERLRGRLAGIPVEFSPDTPPPLALPAMRFTDVTVQNAAMRGGTLRIPGVDVDLS